MYVDVTPGKLEKKHFHHFAMLILHTKCSFIRRDNDICEQIHQKGKHIERFLCRYFYANI